MIDTESLKVACGFNARTLVEKATSGTGTRRIIGRQGVDDGADLYGVRVDTASRGFVTLSEALVFAVFKVVL